MADGLPHLGRPLLWFRGWWKGNPAARAWDIEASKGRATQSLGACIPSGTILPPMKEHIKKQIKTTPQTLYLALTAGLSLLLEGGLFWSDPQISDSSTPVTLQAHMRVSGISESELGTSQCWDS